MSDQTNNRFYREKDSCDDKRDWQIPPLMFLTAVANAYDPVEGLVEFDSQTWLRIRNAIYEIERAGRSATQQPQTGPLTLDTEREVFFYEQDHYYLSNFSAFKVNWLGVIFHTAEHAYHWTRFPHGAPERTIILESASAHEAFRFAQDHKASQLANWNEVKVRVMRDIIRAKAHQHEYVLRKLLQTGDRTLIENSWCDPFWGWGPNRDGKNMLGVLWMEIRAELRSRSEGRTA